MQCNRMTYACPFPLGRYNADIVCPCKCFPEGQEAFGVDTIIIGEKNQHEIAQIQRISPTCTARLKGRLHELRLWRGATSSCEDRHKPQIIENIGATGFEPAASCTPSKCAKP